MINQIYSSKTGQITLRDFDQGIIGTLGAEPVTVPAPMTDHERDERPSGVEPKFIPGYRVAVPVSDGKTRQVNVYFAQPETAFRSRTFPLITIERSDATPALHRWMSVGQLEYRVGVPGTETAIQGREGFLSYESKLQAMPYDITYTISGFDRYEVGAQAILTKLLRVFQPVGRLIVFDSLNLQRSYEMYAEGGIANLQELVDPVTRVRGYALTLRVEAELDVTDPYVVSAVGGVKIQLHVDETLD